MIPKDRERLHYLSSRIQEEKDPVAFDGLVRELNDLLGPPERPQVNPRINEGGD